MDLGRALHGVGAKELQDRKMAITNTMKAEINTNVKMIPIVMEIEHALNMDGVKELQDDLIEQTINLREVYLYKLLKRYKILALSTKIFWINKIIRAL